MDLPRRRPLPEVRGRRRFPGHEQDVGVLTLFFNATIYSEICGKLVEFFSVLQFFSTKNGAKELKNHKILDWCKAENVKLEKR